MRVEFLVSLVIRLDRRLRFARDRSASRAGVEVRGAAVLEGLSKAGRRLLDGGWIEVVLVVVVGVGWYGSMRSSTLMASSIWDGWMGMSSRAE